MQRSKAFKSADKVLIKLDKPKDKPKADKPKADKPQADKPKAGRQAEGAKPKAVDEVEPELAEQWADGYDDEASAVCQTVAIKANNPWGLLKQDLERVSHTKKRNPHKSAAPMKLFTIRDLRLASLRKHGSFEALHAHREKKAAKASKAKVTRNVNKADRKLTLVHFLNNLGLELRNDSALCQQFINIGVVDGWNEKKIAERMAQMHWLHNYTKYTTYIDNNRKIYREMDDRWDTEEIRDMAEAEALSNSGVNGEFPTVWPWMRG